MTWESSDEPPRITEPATRTTTQMTARATPAPLTLEVGVGGDQEGGGRAHAS